MLTDRDAVTTRRKTALEWTDRARDDLVEIGDYIAADAPRAAERWVAKLFEAAEAASKAPLAGRRVRAVSSTASCMSVLPRLAHSRRRRGLFTAGWVDFSSGAPRG